MPRSWQLFLASFAKFYKIFQNRGKKSKKTFGLLGKKIKSLQYLCKRTEIIRLLAKNNLGFLRLLAKILAIILGKHRKILIDSSRSRKKIQEIPWSFSQQNQKKNLRCWQENQENSWIACQKNVGFLRLLAKILAIILGKHRKILIDSSRSRKEIQEISWSFSQQNQKKNLRSWQENQENSWVSYQGKSWIFDISCQDLGKNFRQRSQIFARFLKIVERNTRIFLDFSARKSRVSNFLARELKKFRCLAKKYLGFLRLLAKILAIFLSWFAGFCKIFPYCGIGSKKLF